MDDTQARGPDAASAVAHTAKEQALNVADEARTQARTVVQDARERLTAEAHVQSDRLADGIRRTADELNRMVGEHADSPARKVVSRLADGGRQLADYLNKNGPDGVLAEVQAFARRRPAAFLTTALAVGFAAGQIGKSVFAAGESTPDHGRAGTDSRRFTGTAPVPADMPAAGAYAGTDAVPTPPTQRDQTEPPPIRTTP